MPRIGDTLATRDQQPDAFKVVRRAPDALAMGLDELISYDMQFPRTRILSERKRVLTLVKYGRVAHAINQSNILRSRGIRPLAQQVVKAAPHYKREVGFPVDRVDAVDVRGQTRVALFLGDVGRFAEESSKIFEELCRLGGITVDFVPETDPRIDIATGFAGQVTEASIEHIRQYAPATVTLGHVVPIIGEARAHAA